MSWLGLALCLAAGPASAVGQGAGRNTSEFLSLRPSARALGLADSFGPVAEGPDAAFFNPAGLAALRAPAFAYTRNEYLRMFHHDYYALAAPFSRLDGGVAFSASILTQDTLPLVDKDGVAFGYFRPHSEAFSLAYGRTLHGGGEVAPEADAPSTWSLPGTVRARVRPHDPWKAGLAFGAALKAVYERYYNVRGNALAADLGFLWRPETVGGLSLSAAGRNLGGPMKFAHEKPNLPGELSVGAAYDARLRERHRFLPVLELHLPYYGEASAGLALEYSVQWVETGVRLSYRAGYDTHAVYDNELLAGLTVGLGFQVDALSVDFGFQPQGALGDSFRMSLGWAFGP
ncbi:MAG: hypothetical protein HY554_19295 [Elusimicrobia bacterium]|nr:hypothetical protein [Elusimicrobiota bacterium]